MRLVQKQKLVPGLPKLYYFSVFARHQYVGMRNMEFCWVCNHSKYIHVLYGVG